MAEEEDGYLEIKIVGDWSQFDEEVAQRENQLGNKTFQFGAPPPPTFNLPYSPAGGGTFATEGSGRVVDTSDPLRLAIDRLTTATENTAQSMGVGPGGATPQLPYASTSWQFGRDTGTAAPYSALSFSGGRGGGWGGSGGAGWDFEGEEVSSRPTPLLEGPGGGEGGPGGYPPNYPPIGGEDESEDGSTGGRGGGRRGLSGLYKRFLAIEAARAVIGIASTGRESNIQHELALGNPAALAQADVQTYHDLASNLPLGIGNAFVFAADPTGQNEANVTLPLKEAQADQQRSQQLAAISDYRHSLSNAAEVETSPRGLGREQTALDQSREAAILQLKTETGKEADADVARIAQGTDRLRSGYWTGVNRRAVALFGGQSVEDAESIEQRQIDDITSRQQTQAEAGRTSRFNSALGNINTDFAGRQADLDAVTSSFNYGQGVRELISGENAGRPRDLSAAGFLSFPSKEKEAEAQEGLQRDALVLKQGEELRNARTFAPQTADSISSRQAADLSSFDADVAQAKAGRQIENQLGEKVEADELASQGKALGELLNRQPLEARLTQISGAAQARLDAHPFDPNNPAVISDRDKQLDLARQQYRDQTSESNYGLHTSAIVSDILSRAQGIDRPGLQLQAEATGIERGTIGTAAGIILKDSTNTRGADLALQTGINRLKTAQTDYVDQFGSRSYDSHLEVQAGRNFEDPAKGMKELTDAIETLKNLDKDIKAGIVEGLKTLVVND